MPCRADGSGWVYGFVGVDRPGSYLSLQGVSTLPHAHENVPTVYKNTVYIRTFENLSFAHVF